MCDGSSSRPSGGGSSPSPPKLSPSLLGSGQTGRGMGHLPAQGSEGGKPMCSGSSSRPSGSRSSTSPPPLSPSPSSSGRTGRGMGKLPAQGRGRRGPQEDFRGQEHQCELRHPHQQQPRHLQHQDSRAVLAGAGSRILPASSRSNKNTPTKRKVINFMQGKRWTHLSSPGPGNVPETSGGSSSSSSTGAMQSPSTLGWKGGQGAPRRLPGARVLREDNGTLCAHELTDCRKCSISLRGESKTTRAVQEISAGQWERSKSNLTNKMQNLEEVIGQDHLTPNTDDQQPEVTHST